MSDADSAAVEAMGSPVIYDLTIAYDNDGRPDEPSMLAGRFPRRVVVRVDRFTKTPRDAKKWLFERWARKEERLAAGLTGEALAPSRALVHVLFGAFIASLACYALCVDWRKARLGTPTVVASTWPPRRVHPHSGRFRHEHVPLRPLRPCARRA